MKLYKIASQDIISRQTHRIVLIKDRQYEVFKNEYNIYCFIGEDGKTYILDEHPEWFVEKPGNFIPL